MTLREIAMLWVVKAGTVLGFLPPRVHLPEDFLRDMRHTKRNRLAVFGSAETIAERMTKQQAGDTRSAELRDSVERSSTTIEQVVRDMARRRG